MGSVVKAVAGLALVAGLYLLHPGLALVICGAVLLAVADAPPKRRERR